MTLASKLKSLFETPTANQLAIRELEEAKRQLLGALSAQEYAKAMVQYHTDRVNRLGQAQCNTK